MRSEYAREVERLQRERAGSEEISRAQQLAAEANENSRYIFYSFLACGIAILIYFCRRLLEDNTKLIDAAASRREVERVRRLQVR